MQTFKSAKLIITVVNSHYAEMLIEAMKRAGVTGGTRISGLGLADYRVPGGLPSLEAPEDLIFSVVSDNIESIISAIKQTVDDNPQEVNGMVMVLEVPGFFLRWDYELKQENNMENKRSEAMISGTTLITSIINHGFADEVMAVARAAGARGGSVITARGTGTEDDVKFFGISLVPEKEILMIAAPEKALAPILAAIHEVSDLSEPGSGIAYTMNIEEFIILGK